MSTESKKPPILQNPILKPALPFIIGGTSGIIATTCIQPIDMVKTRIQLSSGPIKPTPITVVKDVIARGRLLDLYTGLSAAVLRQIVYGTSRLGLFFTFEDMLKGRAATHGTTYGFRERAGAGLAAGALGSMLGNPTEVALVRMQSDGLRPTEQRANYRSVFDALARITRNEGVLALWSGAYPTVIRAMAVNMGQLAFFSESKYQISQHTSASEQTQTIAASFIAGFFASALSLPFDFTKSRLQSQRPGADGSVRYKGMLDCFVKVAREDGILKFYRGFGTYFMRIAPHTWVITDTCIHRFTNCGTE